MCKTGVLGIYEMLSKNMLKTMKLHRLGDSAEILPHFHSCFEMIYLHYNKTVFIPLSPFGKEQAKKCFFSPFLSVS